MTTTFTYWDEYDDRPWTALPKVPLSFERGDRFPVLTVEMPAQVGFTKPMTEESLIDRMARLNVEGHR